MEEILLFASLLLPVIGAITELIKKTVNVRKRFVPVIAFAVGILIGVISINFGDLELVDRIWAGGLAGLSTTGLFELALNKDEEKKKTKDS